MHTLIFANHGMGDVIMTLPLLRAATSAPDDHALIITKSEYESELVSLCLEEPGRYTCIGLRELAPNYLQRAVMLMKALRRHKPDAAVLTCGVEPVRGGIFCVLSGARTRIGPNTPRVERLFTHKLPAIGANEPDPGFHKVEYACLAAEVLGRSAERSVRTLLPATEAGRLAEGLLEPVSDPVIAIALGSGEKEKHKRLPADLARRLLELLSEEQGTATFVLLGGPSEREMNISLASVIPERTIDLTGKTSLRELFAVLQRACVVYATCNGVSHIAAATGCPVIGLFGPTNPELTGPFGVPLKVIRLGLSCSPCYSRRFPYGCGNPVCMQLDVKQAASAAAKFIPGNRGTGGGNK